MKTNSIEHKQCIHDTAIKMARLAHKGQPYKLSEFHELWVPAAHGIVEQMAELVARAYLNGHVDGMNKKPIGSNKLVKQLGLIPNQ